MAATSSSFQVHPQYSNSHLQPNTLLVPAPDSSILKVTKKRRVLKKPSSSTNASHSGEKRGKKVKKDGEEEKTGYIHVRARRGQATDSHSLAERVRREKISERMKLLQSLVPGCHKVTGKAVMLDEIINYVQSLQNQVELLSMKLASVNLMPYDFGVDIESFMIYPDQCMQQDLNFSMDNNNGYKYNSSQVTFANSTPFQQILAPNTFPQGSSHSIWEEGDDERGIMMNDPGSDSIFF